VLYALVLLIVSHLFCLLWVGLIVTGHERGELFVWHDVVPWLQAASTAAQAQAQAAAAAAAAKQKAGSTSNAVSSDAAGDKASKKGRYYKNKGKERAAVAFTEDFAAPLCTKLHWHAHPGRGTERLTDIYFIYRHDYCAPYKYEQRSDNLSKNSYLLSVR
jgi:hypothetical protein